MESKLGTQSRKVGGGHCNHVHMLPVAFLFLCFTVGLRAMTCPWPAHECVEMDGHRNSELGESLKFRCLVSGHGVLDNPRLHRVPRILNEFSHSVHWIHHVIRSRFLFFYAISYLGLYRVSGDICHPKGCSFLFGWVCPRLCP